MTFTIEATPENTFATWQHKGYIEAWEVERVHDEIRLYVRTPTGFEVNVNCQIGTTEAQAMDLFQRALENQANHTRSQ